MSVGVIDDKAALVEYPLGEAGVDVNRTQRCLPPPPCEHCRLTPAIPMDAAEQNDHGLFDIGRVSGPLRRYRPRATAECREDLRRYTTAAPPPGVGNQTSE